MRVSTLLVLSLSTASLLGTTPALTQQVQSSTFTGSSPDLVDADSTYNYVRSPLARYYFTINLPQNSVESLKKVSFQGIRSPEFIIFQLENTQAFFGTQQQPGQKIPLENIIENKETKTISVVFKEPIPPGTNFTISLKPTENPSVSGVYLIGVTAFPEGENPLGLPLGVGQLYLARPR